MASHFSERSQKILRGAGKSERFDESRITLGYHRYRLGFRAVTGATNERAMVVSVIPRNVVAGNSLIVNLPVTDRVEDGKWVEKSNVTYKELLACVALLGSFVCDWFIRLKILTNMNMFYFYQLPVPRLSDRDPEFIPIVERTAKLICTTRGFDDLARETGLGSYKNGVTGLAERAKLRAELDGIIAHLYGVTEDEFTHILSTFPLVEQSVKEAAIEAYRELAPKPGDREIAALIAKGESSQLEFKSSARWDYKQGKQNRAMEDSILRTIAAFLNTDGGNLLIGVDDERNVLGLDQDYKLFGKKDSRDAYENFLTTLLLNNLGKDCSALISISIHQLDGKDIAKVVAKASPKPIFVRDDRSEHLYIRAGNSTRLLSTREAIEYCRMKWK